MMLNGQIHFSYYTGFYTHIQALNEQGVIHIFIELFINSSLRRGWGYVEKIPKNHCQPRLWGLTPRGGGMAGGLGNSLHPQAGVDKLSKLRKRFKRGKSLKPDHIN
jgi:hypothetical protein